MQTLSTLKPGSICTVENGDGTFSIVKVLLIDEQQAHVAIYKNRYNQRPSQTDLSTLSCGSIFDEDKEIGVGHVPLSREGFDNWKPIVIDYEEITSDHLVGYEKWKTTSPLILWPSICEVKNIDDALRIARERVVTKDAGLHCPFCSEV